MEEAMTGLGLAVLLVLGACLLLAGILQTQSGYLAIAGSILILAFVIGVKKFGSRSGE